MLYSKNGSIPKPQTDGTDGWVEVPEPPSVGDGVEVVWWYPPGWVARPVKPADEEGFVWKWSQSEGEWMKCPVPVADDAPATIELEAATASISLNLGSATSSAGPSIL